MLANTQKHVKVRGDPYPLPVGYYARLIISVSLSLPLPLNPCYTKIVTSVTVIYLSFQIGVLISFKGPFLYLKTSPTQYFTPGKVIHIKKFSKNLNICYNVNVDILSQK